MTYHPIKRSRLTSLLLIIAWTFFGNASMAYGIMIDSDLDGVTDYAETAIHHTDPLRSDSDRDGISDGKELIDRTDPLDFESVRRGVLPATPAASIVTDHASTSLSWYMGRATGILSFVLVTLVIANGLFISSRSGASAVRPTNLELHRFGSWLLILTVFLHGISFTFDRFIRLTWIELVVPISDGDGFLASLGLDRNLAIAFGIVGLYVVTLLILTAEFRKRLPTKAWRTIHYAGFIGYMAMVACTVMTRTDPAPDWARVLSAASGVAIIALSLARIRVALTSRKQAPESGMAGPATA